MSSEGWIKLYRQLQENPLWSNEKFTKGQAWVDFLLMANHKDKKIFFNNEIITIKRGQFLTSIVKLADRWKWNRKTVSSYLYTLQKERMITKTSDNRKTLITIENYGIYQSAEEIDGQQNGQLITQQNGHQNGQQRDSRTDTNKNVKNDKNINNNIMSISAINALFEELWLLYPRKKGKGQISDAKKRKIAEVGKEQMIRAIERYKRYVSTQKDLSYQYGSTFFNSGYIDYLDENYVEREEVPQKTLRTEFNNFEGRSYDMGSLEQQLLNN